MSEYEFVVTGYYPEWDRGTMWYRVERIGGLKILVLRCNFSDAAHAWEWLDEHRMEVER